MACLIHYGTIVIPLDFVVFLFKKSLNYANFLYCLCSDIPQLLKMCFNRKTMVSHLSLRITLWIEHATWKLRLQTTGVPLNLIEKKKLLYFAHISNAFSYNLTLSLLGYLKTRIHFHPPPHPINPMFDMTNMTNDT